MDREGGRESCTCVHCSTLGNPACAMYTLIFCRIGKCSKQQWCKVVQSQASDENRAVPAHHREVTDVLQPSADAWMRRYSVQLNAYETFPKNENRTTSRNNATGIRTLLELSHHMQLAHTLSLAIPHLRHHVLVHTPEARSSTPHPPPTSWRCSSGLTRFTSSGVGLTRGEFLNTAIHLGRQAPIGSYTTGVLVEFSHSRF